MKNSILISAIALLLLNCSAKVNAQGTAINNTGAAADNSALLDLNSTTQGFVMPRMTEAQRNSIVSPTEALMIYNTSCKCFEAYVNGAWSTVSCPTACNPPAAPAALAASNIDCNSFTANWSSSNGATNYFIDVSTDAGFSTFITGYNNLSVGNFTAAAVTGLVFSSSYYYRVRAFTTCVSGNSNTVGPVTTLSYPSTPGAISGFTSQIPNSAGQVYSISAVTGATSYSWTVPTGWTITGGGTTTSITVTVGTAGQNGNITVTANNSCGSSSPQTLAVTVDVIPPTIPNLWIWYDADDASSFTLSGSSVTQWNDKSGNAINASQSNSSYKPTRESNIVNGRSVVRFNGSNNYLETQSLQFFQTNNSPKTVIFVLNTTNNSGYQHFILTHPYTTPSCNNETEIGIRAGDIADGNFGVHAGCGNATVTAGGVVATGTWNIMSLQFKSSGSTPNQLGVYKNGGSPVTLYTGGSGYWAAGSYPTQSKVLYLGGRVFLNDAYYAGDIAEVLIYNRQLTSSELNVLHNYFSQKYNITVTTVP